MQEREADVFNAVKIFFALSSIIVPFLYALNRTLFMRLSIVDLFKKKETKKKRDRKAEKVYISIFR